jgi:hypothetical protein
MDYYCKTCGKPNHNRAGIFDDLCEDCRSICNQFTEYDLTDTYDLVVIYNYFKRKGYGVGVRDIVDLIRNDR